MPNKKEGMNWWYTQKKKKKGWISKALLWVKEVSKGYVLYDSFIGHSEKVKNTGIKNR